MEWLTGGRLARRAFAAVVVLFGLALAPARADVVVQIDKSSQRMAVSVDGTMRYSWPVSTGRDGYGTPSGTFHPQSMARHYFSRKYYNAPMPHAIFFITALPFTAPTTWRVSAAPHRMAVSGCIRRMRRRCSHWSSNRGREIRGSRYRTSPSRSLSQRLCCQLWLPGTGRPRSLRFDNPINH